MSRAYYLVGTLILLSGFSSALAQVQSDVGRPRRTQTPATATETGDRKLATAQPRLAQAMNPRIGLDFDDQLVAAADEGRQDLDVADLHGERSSGLAVGR